MRHCCPLLAAIVSLGGSAAVLYALAGAATWGRLDPRALVIEAAGGTLAGILAGICWATMRREAAERRREAAERQRAQDEQDKRDLIRTLAALAPDEPGNPGRAAGPRLVR